MAELPTMRIVHPKRPERWAIINVSDFNPQTMVRWEDLEIPAKPPVAEAIRTPPPPPPPPATDPSMESGVSAPSDATEGAAEGTEEGRRRPGRPPSR